MDYNLLIGISALVTSIIALLYTRSSIKIQKSHNEKSLSPLPMIETGDFENDIYIKLINKGNGPLIINHIDFFVDKCSEKILVNLMPDNLKYQYWNTFYVPNEKEILQVNNEIIILQKHLETGVQEEELNFLIELRSFLAKLEINIVYSDIYNNRRYHKEKLIRFNRRIVTNSPISRVDEVGIKKDDL